jgi:hypothetical protein
MLRRAKNVAVLSLAVLAGCQNYNFNPAGHCIIQPGSTTFTLADLSSADVLFVVDDSGSMAAKQQSLASNFGEFIKALNAINVERIGKNLDPIDFHLAITTSSVFEDNTVSDSSTTTAKCGSDGLCLIGRPRDNPTASFQYVCTPGEDCGDLSKNFRADCPGGAKPYPQGDFVAASGNPKVLHFEKALYKDANGASGTRAQTDAIDALIAQFKQNVAVGTCGSGQEQHLEAGRKAIFKATHGQQTEGNWPHENAKMVVVFVGDEDDCSNPDNSTNSIVSTNINKPGEDGCTADAQKPIDQQRLYKVAGYVDFFTGLAFSNGKKRPLGAAFIASATDPACGQTNLGAGCTAAICTYNGGTCSGNCGGYAASTRLLAVADGLRSSGADLVVGSVCDSQFGTILANIGNLLKPPNTLKLKTTPADREVTLLRITDPTGKQRKVCNGPAPAGDTTGAFDWWFVASETSTTPTGPSQLVYINHATGNCELNQGETYSAEYLGMVPEGGCTSSADCAAKLGGTQDKWSCTAKPETPGVPGTCLCAGE